MKLGLKSIGHIHSPHRQAEGTPIQPRSAVDIEGRVEVFPEFHVFPVERTGWYANAHNRATADGRFTDDARIAD
jgi:hypothetical protein